MSSGPFDFAVLGRVDLRKVDGTAVGSILAQPKRVALLAYLAIEGARAPLPREALLAVFWPEVSDERGRAALRSSLHHLRRSLGADCFVTEGDRIQLDASVVRTDAVALFEAIDRGDHRSVLSTYGGELLAAHHVDERAFEAWLDTRRSAALLGYATAALTLAEPSPDDASVLPHLTRLVELAPGNEVALRTLLSLLHRSAGRGAALTQYRRWTEVLRERLDLEPSPETERFVEELLYATDVPPQATDGPLEAAMVVDREPTDERPPPPNALESRRLPPAIDAASRSGRRAAWSALAVVASVAVVATLARPRAPEPIDAYLLSDFTWIGEAGPEYVARVMPMLVSRHLEANGVVASGEVGPKSEPCVKGSTSPEAAVEGSVTDLGDGRLEIRSCLIDRHGKIRSEGRALSREADVLTAALSLAASLWGGLGRSSDLTPAPPITEAPGALLPFSRAESFRRAADFEDAAEAYADALALDSTFAWASYRLSTALSWISQDGRAAADQALAHSSRLSARELQLLDAWRAYLWGGAEEASQALEAIVAQGGADAETLFRVGELRFHWGDRLGFSREATDSAFRQHLAHVPNYVPSMLHLARLVGHDGSLEELRLLISRARENGAGTVDLSELETAEALRSGNVAEARRGSEPWRGAESDWVIRGRRLGHVMGSLPNPAAIVEVTPSFARDRTGWELVWRWYEINGLAAAGRTREARAALDSLRELNPSRALEGEAWLTMLPHVTSGPAALSDLLGRLETLPPAAEPMGSRSDFIHVQGIFPLRRIFLETWLRYQIEGRISGEDFKARASPFPDQFQREFQRLADALEQLSHGGAGRALGELGPPSPLPDGTYSDAMGQVWALERWLRIQALLELGREDEALTWLGTFPDPLGSDVALLGPTLVLRGELRERKGQRDLAVAAYRHALDLWSEADSDPSLEAWLDRARNGLGRLGSH